VTGILASVFVASVTGSLHCAGMCGGLVGFVAGSDERRFLPQLAYHLGRLLGYATLGALAGLFGSALNLGGELVGFTEAATVVAALLMIVWGVARLLPLRAGRLLHKPWRPGAAGFSALLHRASRHSPIVRGGLLGAFTAALPCGWLYAFVLVAAGTGSWLAGISTMSVFWLGTVPALVGVGALVRPLSTWVGHRAPVLGAAALVLAGLGTLTVHYVFAPPPDAPASCPLHHGPMQRSPVHPNGVALR
jgi:hypothetical protein